MNSKKSILTRILKIILSVLGVIILLFAAWIGALTVTEFKPEEETPLEISASSGSSATSETSGSSDSSGTSGSAPKTLSIGEEMTIMTWNIGYAGLSENADFFMDGGDNVTSCDKDQVQENLRAITEQISALSPDIIYLQEVDTNSSRTYHINEAVQISESLQGYQSAHALNYSCLYVPYPLPPIGQVNSGIQTLSTYELSDAARISLPVPFSYPVRLANLKRCLLVSRVPIEDSERELVLINLHLEAYDDGEGKAAQTKMLRDILETEIEKGNYVIAGGDFNQVFSSTDQSNYPILGEDFWQPGVLDTADFDDSLQFVMDSSAPTCRSLDRPMTDAESLAPSDFQYYMIDGFIVSGNLTIESAATLDLGFKNSDHNPVVMKLVLE